MTSLLHLAAYAVVFAVLLAGYFRFERNQPSPVEPQLMLDERAERFHNWSVTR